MARPTKLTNEVQEQIVQLIRVGNTVEVAAETAGITERTFYGWMARGDTAARKTKRKQTKTDHRYIEFRDAIDQARAEAEALLVTRITKAAQNGSWSAAAWLLERRFPHRWAKPTEEKPKPTKPDEPPKPSNKQQDQFAELDELAPRREARAQAG